MKLNPIKQNTNHLWPLCFKNLPLLFLLACTTPQEKEEARQFCSSQGYQANSLEFNDCIDAYEKAKAHMQDIARDCGREADSAYLGAFRLNPSLTDDEAKSIADAARSDCLKTARLHDKDELFKRQQLYLIERQMGE